MILFAHVIKIIFLHNDQIKSETLAFMKLGLVEVEIRNDSARFT